MKNWKKVAIGATIGTIIIASIIIIGLLAIRYETKAIHEYIGDSEQYSKSWTGHMAGFSITLTSTNDDMNIKIVVDGMTVYERNHVYDANFKYKMNSGHHMVCIIITNPSILGLGSSILVTGEITFQNW